MKTDDRGGNSDQADLREQEVGDAVALRDLEVVLLFDANAADEVRKSPVDLAHRHLGVGDVVQTTLIENDMFGQASWLSHSRRAGCRPCRRQIPSRFPFLSSTPMMRYCSCLPRSPCRAGPNSGKDRFHRVHSR